MDEATNGEDVDAFRLRAREWLAATMPRLPDGMSNRQLVQQDEMGSGPAGSSGRSSTAGSQGSAFPPSTGGRD